MDLWNYLDFELKITSDGDHYIAHVYRSPAGEARVEFTLRLTWLEIENLILRLTRLRSVNRAIDSPEMEAARKLGAELFDAVFQGQVRDCFRTSLQLARSTPKTGLRIKLRLQEAPDLANLPWEFLYDTTFRRFLAQSNQTPLVRYVEMPESITPLKTPLPLRILGIISAPSDYTPLNTRREKRLVQKALEPLLQTGLVEIDWLKVATLDKLRLALRNKDYHIFHFIGHGGFDQNTAQGMLILENDRGSGEKISGERLGVLLHDHATMRLAVLNACEGARNTAHDPFASVATTLVQQGLPAVIAMQFAISDTSALTFSTDFYAVLAEGWPVDAAMAEARKAIAVHSEIEWATPVLYLRAPDGMLFDLPPRSSADNKPAGTPSAAEGSRPGIDLSPTGARRKTPGTVSRKRQEQFDNLMRFINEKPADAARLYLDLKKTPTDADRLEEVWAAAPVELKNLVALELVIKDRRSLTSQLETLGKEKVEQALMFALQRRLDEDWESRAAAILQEIIGIEKGSSRTSPLDGQLFLLNEQRTREALLRVWTTILYWRLPSPPDRDAPIQEKWDFYQYADYPFGAPHAEENNWLFDGRFSGRYTDLSALVGVERVGSVIVMGQGGWGKTTTALWLMDYALQSKFAFPVYLPIVFGTTLAEIAPIFARTVMYYLAINPQAFLRRGLNGRASIAHLFAEYIGTGARLQLRLGEAGLPRTGAGLEVEKELLRFSTGYTPGQITSDQEILNLLSESYPQGFTTTWLLIDVHENLENKVGLEHFWKLIRQLNSINLKTKIFLSSGLDNRVTQADFPQSVRNLIWEDDDLKGLIKTRLERLGEGNLALLCKSETRHPVYTPEVRLVRAVGGSPGMLVQKGNQLLKRYSQNQGLLSMQDLDEILGPIPKRTTRSSGKKRLAIP